jgi:hypothetical protein
MTPSSLIIVVVAVDGANTKDFFRIDRAKLLLLLPLPLLVDIDCHRPPPTKLGTIDSSANKTIHRSR